MKPRGGNSTSMMKFWWRRKRQRTDLYKKRHFWHEVFAKIWIWAAHLCCCQCKVQQTEPDYSGYLSLLGGEGSRCSLWILSCYSGKPGDTKMDEFKMDIEPWAPIPFGEKIAYFGTHWRCHNNNDLFRITSWTDITMPYLAKIPLSIIFDILEPPAFQNIAQDETFQKCSWLYLAGHSFTWLVLALPNVLQKWYKFLINDPPWNLSEKPSILAS